MQVPFVQIIQQVLGGSQADIQLHPRIFRMIFPQIVHDDGDVGIDNADFQDAAKSFIYIPDTLDHHAEILKHVLTLLIQAASCLGQLHALVVAQKEAYP